ncbi:hypothetical protein HELRODRAFT_135084, partial [Helobdella robusta]|uniref:J domain-containing protein n=1 Tax=Helobdella robusta TaxID=6412 RepID=T1EI69_HELRO
CWKCGRSIEPDMEQYFCVCGVVQPPLEHRSFFQIFGIKEDFDIDLKYLNEKYRKLQVILHPDKYSQKSDTERGFSERHSSLVNEAYNTLLKPLSRGLYILHLKGEDLEKEVQVETEFLGEIMELNESVIEAEDINALRSIETSTNKIVNNLIDEISHNFKDKNTNSAKENLLKLKYLLNVAEKIQ